MKTKKFTPFSVAVLTISDTRTEASDSSGKFLTQAAEADGHKVFARKIVPDNIYAIRAAVSAWIADPEVQVILTTGGTGFYRSDVTVEAVEVLFDKKVEGFGELFRQISLKEIGTSTTQSSCTAGTANNTFVFCLPGSPNACKTAWEGILSEQFDITRKSCSFARIFVDGF